MIFNGKRKKLEKEAEELNKKIALLKEENASLKVENQKLNDDNSLLKKNNSHDENMIFLLNEELTKIKDELKTLNSERDQIIDDAQKSGQNIIDEAQKIYDAEIKRLRDFVVRWQANLPEPKERTSNSRKRNALCLLLSEILNDNPIVYDIDEGVKLVEKLDNAIGGNGGGESGGFSMEEVLNPSGELDLAQLCKELGVME